jgi:hypothetical protein
MAVYEFFDGPTALRRAFTLDFERYSPEGVRLFIAVR